jgi:ABC-type transporter MlaC component
MRTVRLIAAFALAGAMTMPVASRAQMAMKPTQEQVMTALKATKPSLSQMREMKPLLQTYKSETANADDATKKASAKKLIDGLKTILTPEQQDAFKKSMMSQLSAAK